MRRVAPALVAAAALLVTACGGAETAQTGSSDAASTPAATPAASSPAASSPAATPAASSPAASSPAASPAATTPPAPLAASGFVSFDAYQSDKAAHDAGTVVLFFNASWCPTCKRTVKNLEADPAAIADDLTIVSVDYDSSGDLKRKYGVTYQHTFVQVDADGEQLAKWSGSETAEAIADKTV